MLCVWREGGKVHLKVSRNGFRACFEERNDHVSQRIASDGNCVIRDNTCGYRNFTNKFCFEANLLIQQPQIVCSYLRLGRLRGSFRSGTRNKN